MVHYQRYHNPLKKGIELAPIEEDEEAQNICGTHVVMNKITKPKLLTLLFLSLLSCSLIFAPYFLNFPSDFSLLYTFGLEDTALVSEKDVKFALCSSVPNGTICCDRSSIRTDICTMKGDVRTHSPSSSLYLYTSKNIKGIIDYSPDTNLDTDEEREEEIQHEKVKPYTRKWEASTMSTIDELDLILKNENSKNKSKCDVNHDVPAVFFSTGGYTGNVYHEFNDGILPLYITSQHFNKRVVFVIVEYHDWWYMKYGDIVSQLSDFPPIDFSGDKRVHCFPEAIVGLKIHDELTVDSALMQDGKTIRDFHNLLDRSYSPRIKDIILEEEQNALPSPPSSIKSVKLRKGKKTRMIPKLVIISRNGSRAIQNQEDLVKMAEKIGFQVEVFTPQKTSELAKIYQVLNSSDVMIGVHGAAMTHLLFMKPGSVFIQVVPLGTDWAAETYYGEPAKKLGLKYIGYKIHPRESSLYNEYAKDDPVLVDPDSVGEKGWEFTKKIYLDNQNVRLNMERFQKRLVRAYEYSFAKKNKLPRHQTR